MEQHEEESGIASLGPSSLAEERPLTELVSRLSHDAGLLIEQEIALAKQEAADKLAQLKGELVGLTIAGVLLHAGVLALIASGILVLAAVLPPWLSALIMASALIASGGILVLRAKSQLAKLDLAPRKLVRNLKEDVQAVKEAAR